MNKRYDVRPFTPDVIDDAARLRAADHARHRTLIPALDPTYEDPAAVRAEIAAIIERENASGRFVTAAATPVAYVIGAPKSDPRWRASVFVDDAGFGGADPEAIREAYAAAAGDWRSAGWTNHYALVSAADAEQIEAWFSLSFGKQHVHALRERADPRYAPDVRSRLTIRRKQQSDIPALAELGRVVPMHVHESPVFSFIHIPSVEESVAEAEADFGDERFTEFVATHQGRVIACAVGCSLELSGMTTRLMRPRNAGFLGHAAVLPEGRGLGAGRAVGQAVIAWSRDEGYEWVATDWRSTNLEANRTWRALGFRPSFFRLHRLIG